MIVVALLAISAHRTTKKQKPRSGHNLAQNISSSIDVDHQFTRYESMHTNLIVFAKKLQYRKLQWSSLANMKFQL